MYSQKNLELLLLMLGGISRRLEDAFIEGEFYGYSFALRDTGVVTMEEFWRLLRVKDAVKNESIKRAHALAKKTIKKIFEETE